MQKSNWIMSIIIAVAITFSALMIWDVSRTFIIQTIFIDTVLSNGYIAVLGFEAWLTTFSPLWIITATFIGALCFAVLINTVVRPRMPFKKTSTPKPYMQGPEYVPPTVLQKTSQELPATKPEPITVKEETTT